MKVGDLVKNKYNNIVGIITSRNHVHPILGVMYSVHVDGLNVLLHETDLELI